MYTIYSHASVSASVYPQIIRPTSILQIQYSSSVSIVKYQLSDFFECEKWNHFCYKVFFSGGCFTCQKFDWHAHAQTVAWTQHHRLHSFWTDPLSVRLWLSLLTHTNTHVHKHTLSVRLQLSSSDVLFSAASCLPSAWEEAASLRSDWLLCRWLPAWLCVTAWVSARRVVWMVVCMYMCVCVFGKCKMGGGGVMGWSETVGRSIGVPGELKSRCKDQGWGSWTHTFLGGGANLMISSSEGWRIMSIAHERRRKKVEKEKR